MSPVKETQVKAAGVSWCVCLIAALFSTAGGQSPTTAPSSQPAARPTSTPAPTAKVRDLCKGAVDPYNPGPQRARFFAATGVDSELDAKEFQADQRRRNPFVLAFDTWRWLRSFDQNGDQTIDWFEADAYRRDVRKRVLALFDTNKDGRLTGAERDAANRALAAGRVSPVKTGPAIRSSRTISATMLKRFDKDGDGKLSRQERRDAVRVLRKQSRDRWLATYDTDGDGKLSPAERDAMHKAMRDRGRPWRDMFDRFNLRHFDLNGDGKLDEAEKVDRTLFQAELTRIGRSFRLRQMDLDGDGNVSDEEKKQAAAEMRRSALQAMVMAIRYIDTDGDGAISETERGDFGERVRLAIAGWVEDYPGRYDNTSDGRLDKDERTKLLKGFRIDFNTRLAKFDKDHSGRLAPTEMFSFINDFAREIGIEPTPTTTTAPAK